MVRHSDCTLCVSASCVHAASRGQEAGLMDGSSEPETFPLQLILSSVFFFCTSRSRSLTHPLSRAPR